ncbi:MAG: GGDEF domain-containing protein [Planctomycetota bacterium]
MLRLHSLRRLTAYVVRSLVEVSSARRVSLMLMERRRRALCLRRARGMPDGLVGKVRCAVASGVAGRAASLGRAVAGRGSRGGLRRYDGSAYVVLPLGRGRDCMGDRAGQALRTARRLRRAESLSTTDELTGLPNRRAFERALRREVERASRAGNGLAVALFDVDHFKSINDRFGHPVGDRVLARVAETLAHAFRDSDLVARWGGEEFAILLPGWTGQARAEVLHVVDRARKSVGDRPARLGPGLPHARVTVSGGVACYPEDGKDGNGLVRAADDALLLAKEGGRDQVLSA